MVNAGANAGAASNTLIAVLWPPAASPDLARKAVLVVAGTLVLTAAAKLQIPFYPVPMTMQTFAVLVLGMVLGARLGAATVAAYLAAGALGLPVFAGTPEKGIGIAYMLGPTGGYLLGFVLAAAACGALGERGWSRNALRTALAMLAGNVLIYVPGLIWLGTLLGWDQPILEWGLWPFLLGDLTKLALAVAVLPLAWRLVDGRR